MSHLRVGRGRTATLVGRFKYAGTSVLVDADPVQIDIIDPGGVDVVTNDSPTEHTSTGIYEYDFPVPEDAPLGVWEFRFSGVINENAVENVGVFEVLPAGVVEFEEGSIATVAEVEEFCRLGTFDSAASVVAASVIQGCQSALEQWLGRPITERVFTEQGALPANLAERGRLYMTMTPVTRIDALEIDGVAPSAESYVLQRWGLDKVAFSGSDVAVTYAAGYDGRSPDHRVLWLTVMRAVKREMKHYLEDDSGISERTSEGERIVFLEPESIFTKRELGGLIRYKRKRMR